MLKWQFRYVAAGLVVAALTPIFAAAGGFGSRVRAWAFPPQSESARISRVIDGDTFVARIKGEPTRVRLIGVDTPESVKRGEKVQCYGRAASDASKHRLSGKTVRLTYDIERTDKYGRTLAYVELNGADYSGWLLKHGYARALAIEPNTAREDRYDRLASRAQRREVGLWGRCSD